MRPALHLSTLAVVASSLVIATGCDDTGTDAPADAPFELEGVWTSDFGEETITSATWTGYVAQTVVQYDNRENIAILRNPEDDQYAPGKYSRVVWTEPEGDAFHYCMVAFGQDTAAAAAAAPESAVDRTDLDEKGCGGFPWSFLTRK